MNSLQEAFDALKLNPIDDTAFQYVKSYFSQHPSGEGTALTALKGVLDRLQSQELPFSKLSSELEKIEFLDFSPYKLSSSNPSTEDEEDDFINFSTLPASSSDIKSESEQIEDSIAPDLLPIFLEEAESHVDSLVDSLGQIDLNVVEKLDFNRLFRSVHTIKGSSASVGLKRLSHAIHSFEDFLSEQREKVQISDSNAPSIESFVQLLDRSFKLLQAGNADEVPYTLLQKLALNISHSTPISDEDQKAIQTALSGKTAKKQDFLKISAERINKLFYDVDRMQTLLNETEILIRSIERHSPSDLQNFRKINDSYQNKKTLINQIQKDIISFRLVPFRQVFPRINRVIKEYSDLTGKPIKFQANGGLVEIKKTVLNKLTDILLHMIKNSMDHGIEDIETRSQLSKDIEGHVTVSARSERSQVIITVEDDGRGIDQEVIRKKAIEKGLTTTDASASLSEEEILNFLFMPGFSTAEKVTSVSGRGVGMDAVKSMVHELGGTMVMTSNVGLGTKTVLNFPSDVSIDEVILVRGLNQVYAILLGSVEAIINVAREEINGIKKYPYYESNEGIIPIFHINQLTGLSNSLEHSEGLLLIKEGNKHIALLVDEIVKKEQVIITPPPAIYEDFKHISGVFSLENGKPCVIIHPCDMLQARKDEVRHAS